MFKHIRQSSSVQCVRRFSNAQRIDNIYFYHILDQIFTMKSTLSKLEPCLFPYFIRFLLIVDYLCLRMVSYTNFSYFT